MLFVAPVVDIPLELNAERIDVARQTVCGERREEKITNTNLGDVLRFLQTLRVCRLFDFELGLADFGTTDESVLSRELDASLFRQRVGDRIQAEVNGQVAA